MGENKAGRGGVVFSNPEGIGAPNGYSHVAEVPAGWKTVLVAGQLGCDAERKLAGGEGDFAAQAHQAFANVRRALRSAGADFGDVVKMNVFLVDISGHMQAFREIRDEWLNALPMPPASTTVGVAGLAVPGALIEIDVVAALP